jgi:hypothetical protein
MIQITRILKIVFIRLSNQFLHFRKESSDEITDLVFFGRLIKHVFKTGVKSKTARSALPTRKSHF